MSAPIDVRPSFRRIHAHLLERISRGEWRPGELMPGENELAREYEVSVGTLRKALDALQAGHVIERRRGRGTTVRRSTSEHTLFSYFRFRDLDTGGLSPPQDEILAGGVMPSNTAERAALQLEPGATVHRIRRLRTLRGRPFLTDVMAFPQARFAEFAWPRGAQSLSAYQYLEQVHGTLVGYVQERLRVSKLSATEARTLRADTGAPALEVLRVAYDLGGAAVEYRRSVALTDSCYYLSELRAARGLG